jgi:UDP-galactopyranose mutase
MPFAKNRATENISPTKTLEYFAASRPVATTPIRDVIDEFGGVVYAGAGLAGFVAAARAALTAPPERIAAGVAAASARTWDAIAARMWNALQG